MSGTYRLDLESRDNRCPDRDIADRLDDVALEVLQDGSRLSAEIRVIPILAEIELTGEALAGRLTARSVDVYPGDRIGVCRLTYAYELKLSVALDGTVSGTLIQTGVTPAKECPPARCRAVWDVTGERLPPSQ